MGHIKEKESKRYHTRYKLHSHRLNLLGVQGGGVTPKYPGREGLREAPSMVSYKQIKIRKAEIINSPQFLPISSDPSAIRLKDCEVLTY